jgi:hypothetical protein
MDDIIITIYCLREEFLEAISHRDGPQVRLSAAEVMSAPLVSAAFFRQHRQDSPVPPRVRLHEGDD